MSLLIERLHDWDAFVEWEPADNDQPPTEPVPGEDYVLHNPWAYEPHPDMEGYMCSTGFVHERRPRKPRGPVGLANVQPHGLPAVRIIESEDSP